VKAYALHPEAEREYDQAAQYYLRDNPQAAARFYDEIERLIHDVRRQPDLFPVLSPPLRRHFSDVFPYALLYEDEPDRVWIVAVMHMKRRPGYWKSRLK